MKYLSLAMLLLLAFTADSVHAQTDPRPGETAAEPIAETDEADTPDIVVEGEVPRKQRRVCQMETATGSIMSRRVCRTVAQIEEEERVARESLEIIKRDRDTRSHVQMMREAGR